MKKSLPVIVICILSFVLFSSLGFAATWTTESSMSNAAAGLPHFFDLDTNTYSTSSALNYDLAVYTTGGKCRLVCHYAFENPTNTSGDNYYCISFIDGNQYQLSSIDTSYFDSYYSYMETSSTATYYLYVRSYDKKHFSRVNATVTYAGGTCVPTTIKHLETQDMANSFYVKSPNPPHLNNDLTFTWDSSVNASAVALMVGYPDGSFLFQPQDDTGKVDHTAVLHGANFVANGTYHFNITSCQGDYFNAATWHNCAICYETYNTNTNTSSGQTCIQSTSLPVLPPVITPPNYTAPPSNTSARIISVNASVTQIPTGYEVLLTTIVQNNGTANYNFYLGQSIGRNSTGVFCNRDCYVDCQMGKIDPIINYGTYQCDYLRTETIHSGQTIILTRKYYFRPDFFVETGFYDIVTAIYSNAYLNPSDAYDVDWKIGYFNVTTVAPVITNLRTAPALTTYIAGKTDVTFIWNTNYNTSTILEIRNPNGSFKSRFSGDGTIGVRDHSLTRGGIGFKVGTYTYIATSCQVVYPFECSNQTKTVTFIDELTDETNPNVVNPLKEAVAEVLGISYDAALAFLAIIITVIVSAYVGIKAKSGTVTIVLMIALFLMFVIMQWLPWWLLILFTILAGFIVAKWGKEIFTG